MANTEAEGVSDVQELNKILERTVTHKTEMLVRECSE